MSTKSVIKNLASVDILTEAKNADALIGRPFYLDYEKACVLVPDAWKMKVGGIPQGTFLLAFYENDEGISEALLLRALGPKGLPTDNDVTSSMIEYYKDNLKTADVKGTQLDDFTRYHFSFSGLECRILGTFYKDKSGTVIFGADLENFYSAHNYTVYKPSGKVLEQIVNYKDLNEVAGGVSDVKIGNVRYSSSLRFQDGIEKVPVYISPKDFIGKRTALFGMTRTGKSNTVKKIIEATVEISQKAKTENGKDVGTDPFTKSGLTKEPIGQIIFDINGEYANANLQDDGTAIFEMYKDDVVRYSLLEKPGFKVMKTNFFDDIDAGFELLCSLLAMDDARFVSNFRSIDLIVPQELEDDPSFKVRHARRVAAYKCCLHQAGFKHKDTTIKFSGEATLNALASGIDPSKGITYDQAVNWFTAVWEAIGENAFFEDYKKKHEGREWADEDLKALLVMLTRKRSPGSDKGADCSGFRVFKPALNLHTESVDKPYAIEILETLRAGKIVIADLSQGNPEIIQLYSEKICQRVFADAMNNFIGAKSNNFIQMYFEEAHNLFPKQTDKDLSKIYNRLAKEGAKLHLGIIYATQEVSSISSNILKNTQNWFIAHLNNEDELKELKKYYDFTDFTTGLTRFSPNTDKGFVRMKTYSNPFVVPVQIDRFTAKK